MRFGGLSLILALPVLGQQAERISLNADFTWGSQHRPGRQSAVVITLDNPGGGFEAELLLRWGLAGTFQRKEVTPESLHGQMGPIYRIPASVPAKSRRRYFANVQGNVEGSYSLWIFLVSGSKCLARFEVLNLPAKDDGPRVGVVGSSHPHGFSGTGVTLSLVRPDELPNRWHGYEAVDVVLWTDADGAQVRDSAHVEALRQWIVGGGRLVIARANTAGFAGTFLEELAPVTSRGSRACSMWSALAEFAGSEEGPRGEGALLEVRPREGNILISAADTPLAVEAPLGRGKVTFLAFDPAAEPFASWRNADRFWKKLLDLPPIVPSDGAIATTFSWSNYYSHTLVVQALGSIELSGLLGQQPGLSLPSLDWVFWLILLYVLLVGPIDYLVLRRLKKMELTWITFPTYVCVFSILALFASLRAAKQAAVYREISVVDQVPAAGMTHGRSLAGILIPKEATVSAVARKSDASIMPVPMIGYNASGEPSVGDGRVDDWYFPRGSTGVAAVKWCEKGVRIRVEPDGPDRVHVTNEGAPLTQSFYLRSDKAYSLGTIPRGRSSFDLENASPLHPGLKADGGEDARMTGRQFPRALKSENELRSVIKSRLLWICFARRFSSASSRIGTGFAAELDASSWIENGGAILMGWSEEASVLDFEDVMPRKTVDTLVRVFVAHD
ncbi:MAG: hypothetical protein HY716_03735 [Planctomycetes bacterium]|nr:hypothetical protein [Planctomycetota bacterium]